jgi:hypothetical protein
MLERQNLDNGNTLHLAVMYKLKGQRNLKIRFLDLLALLREVVVIPLSCICQMLKLLGFCWNRSAGLTIMAMIETGLVI